LELTIALTQKISSFAVLIFLGFFAVKSRIISYEGSKVLSQFALYFLTPCAMLDAFQYDFKPEKLSGMGLALLACLLAVIVFSFLGRTAKHFFAISTVETLSLEYPNAGNLMIPLIAGTMGGEWVIYLSPCFFVMNLFVFTHGQAAMAGLKRISISMLLKNIVIISMVIGLILFLADIRLPGVLGETVQSMSSMMGPIYMFTVGMIMGHADLKKVLKSQKAWYICFGRLVVFPTALLLIIKTCGLLTIHPHSKEILAIVVLTAGAPAAVTITQLAQLASDEEAAVTASTINILSTLLCLFTMPCISAFYQQIA